MAPEDNNAQLLSTILILCGKYGFDEVHTTLDLVLEQVQPVGDESVQRWTLDTYLHEICHFVVARGSVLYSNLDKLGDEFYSFQNNVTEIQTVALVHMVQTRLERTRMWIGVTTSLDDSIRECGLNSSYKTSGRALKMAQIMVDDPQMDAWAKGLMALIKTQHKSRMGATERAEVIG